MKLMLTSAVFGVFSVLTLLVLEWLAQPTPDPWVIVLIWSSVSYWAGAISEGRP